MSYDNTNTGAIFKNDKKSKETQPDYTGKLNVEGKDFSISCWKKESKAGKDFLSCRISEPYNGGGNGNGNSNANNTVDTAKDIPF